MGAHRRRRPAWQRILIGCLRALVWVLEGVGVLILLAMLVGIIYALH